MKLLLCLLLFTCSAYCSRILVITSMPAHSHFTLAFRLAKELADRQYQVTFINPFPQKIPIKNLRDIPIEGTITFAEDLRKKLFTKGTLGKFGSQFMEQYFAEGIVEFTLNDTDVQTLMNSNESFDVVIIEHFVNEALIGIAHHFKAPFIILAPVPSCPKNNFMTGNPGFSSYEPDIYGIYSYDMNFWQRIENFLSIIVHELIREVYMLPFQRKMFKKYIDTELELDDVLYNASLVLATSHSSINDAIPHLPNIIEIGGYHVLPPKKLSKELQDFLDNAKEGVIVFSMGSNVKSKDFSLELRKAILRAFSKIKAKILWKFESNLPDIPENVKIMPWLPQNDVLGHPNVKGFITHGGLLGSIEAVYYGLPIIGIPIFGDQFSNIASAVSKGYGISMPLNQITEDTFLEALNQILYNKKFRENAQRRSRFMHDQPLKPIDSAVYWIEHIIRHQGGSHLKSPALSLNWYQRDMIDVIVFLITIVLLLSTIIYVVIRKCWNYLYKPQKNKAKLS